MKTKSKQWLFLPLLLALLCLLPVFGFAKADDDPTLYTYSYLVDYNRSKEHDPDVPAYYLYSVPHILANLEYKTVVIDHTIYQLVQGKRVSKPYYRVVCYFDSMEALQTKTKINLVDEIDGIPVTRIELDCTDGDNIGTTPYSEKVTSIRLPKNLTYIGPYTFSCLPNLKKYRIPEGVTEIGKWAFLGAENLTSITIPESVTTIGRESFYNCMNLKKITFPSKIHEIENGAFFNCRSLKTVTFKPLNDPTQGVRLRRDVFHNCYSLTKVTLPENANSVGLYPYAFYGCKSLKTIKNMDKVQRLNAHTFDGCKSLTSVTVSPQIIDISPQALKKLPLKKLRVLATDPAFLLTKNDRPAGKGGYDGNDFLKTLPKTCKVYVKTAAMKQAFVNAGCTNKISVKADLA